MIQLGLTTPPWVTALLLSVRGVGVGPVTQPLLETMMARVELERLPDANTLFSAVERLAGSFGIAVLATAPQQREQLHVRAAASGAIGEAMVQGFHDTVLLLAALALLGALASLLVRDPASGRPPTNRFHRPVLQKVVGRVRGQVCYRPVCHRPSSR
jgi:hypothetical protein